MWGFLDCSGDLICKKLYRLTAALLLERCEKAQVAIGPEYSVYFGYELQKMNHSNWLCCTNRPEVDLTLAPDELSLWPRYAVCQEL